MNEPTQSNTLTPKEEADAKKALDTVCEQVGTPEPPDETQPMRDLPEAHAELQRELQVRKRCYGRWISDGRMSRVDAVDRYARLQSALVYIEKFAASLGCALDACETSETVPF